MWIMTLGSVFLAVVLTLLIFTIMQKRERMKTKNKEESTLKNISAGICERLHVVCPDSKWRWVCRPTGFTVNGGIARIEVIYPSGKQQFTDVCLATNGYMALHVLGAVELTASDMGVTPASFDNLINTDEASLSAHKTGARPYDAESVVKWYNIVLIDALTSLIDDLNANGEVCIHIDRDGKAYVEEGGSNTVVYEFGEMPDVTLWGIIAEKLGEAGLFAEVQEGNCIFISWA